MTVAEISTVSSPTPSDFALFNHIHDPVLVVGQKGDVHYLNEAAAALASKMADASGRATARNFLNQLHIVNHEGPTPWEPASEEVSASAIIAFARKFKHQRIFQLYSTRINGDAELFSGWIVQLKDITSLASSMLGEADAVRHRGQLIDLLSHDMRTPLVAIITTFAHPDFKSLHANLREVIERAARLSLRMVDTVVRIVRAESADYAFAPIELSHILEEAIDLVWQAGKDARIKVELQRPDYEFTVMIDRGLMIQVFESFLSTLISHGVSGSSVICILDSAMLDGAMAVRCTIASAVTEVSEMELDQIFKPLTRQGAAEIDGSENLMFARAVIARHQGVLEYESSGTHEKKIVITLPLAEL